MIMFLFGQSRARTKLETRNILVKMMRVDAFVGTIYSGEI